MNEKENRLSARDKRPAGYDLCSGLRFPDILNGYADSADIYANVRDRDSNGSEVVHGKAPFRNVADNILQKNS